MVFIVDDNFIGNKRHVKRLLLSADWSSATLTHSPLLQRPA
jgi:hypothetical protein